MNEDIFAELLKDKGYKTDNDIKIEQYSSDVIQMDKLLKNASKKVIGMEDLILLLSRQPLTLQSL